ncbi:hypothetical protein N2K86_09940 [Enterobacter mori]|uniref:hypothetical protein n=1 Tax=Enterobacter mori TaxID=539813 RepID=UPI0021B14DBD|nr:hypothetical protein [Enterobacter mori]UWX95223.1 hypothetical protein N2K86_09940 [Enterobacter mori]
MHGLLTPYPAAVAGQAVLRVPFVVLLFLTGHLKNAVAVAVVFVTGVPGVRQAIAGGDRQGPVGAVVPSGMYE